MKFECVYMDLRIKTNFVLQNINRLWYKCINQQDAAVSQVYCLKFMCGSTCFGRLSAHHQQHTTALGASGFSVGAWRLGCCCSWCGRPQPTTLQPYIHVHVHLAYFRTFICVIIFDEGVTGFIFIIAQLDEITSKKLYLPQPVVMYVSYDSNKQRLLSCAAPTGYFLISSLC
jgi:hypothetical protein